MHKRFFFFLASSFFLLSCGAPLAQPLNTSQDDSSRLFYASGTDLFHIDLHVYDLQKKTLLESHAVTLADPRASSRFEMDTNDAVQYDPESGVFLFATDGSSEMGGACVNADGTCNGRLYQWQVGDTDPELFWDSEGSIGGWVVDSTDHTVWVSALTELFQDDYDGKSAPLLVHLNLDDGTVLDTFPLSRLGTLHLSSDGKTITEMISEDAHSGQISFAQVDTKTGALSYLDLAFDNKGREQWAEAYLSGLSPDAQYFVYTLNETAATDYGVSSHLIFSPMEQDVTGTVLDFEGNVNNYNFYWSGDSSHFAVGTTDSVLDFDVASLTRNELAPSKESLAYWAPSSRYLLAWQEDQVVIHDLQAQTTTALKTDGDSGLLNLLGLLFY